MIYRDSGLRPIAKSLRGSAFKTLELSSTHRALIFSF